jgi:hypothetical protein
MPELKTIGRSAPNPEAGPWLDYQKDPVVTAPRSFDIEGARKAGYSEAEIQGAPKGVGAAGYTPVRPHAVGTRAVMVAEAPQGFEGGHVQRPC